MRNLVLMFVSVLLIGCDAEFEPRLTGWTAIADGSRPLIYLNMDGRQKNLELPGYDSIGYHNVQWTKGRGKMLLVRSLKTKGRRDYQIISIDTAGAVIDTVFTAPKGSFIYFRLAPNDSLLLIKTQGLDWSFTFFNRFSRTSLPDTIKAGDASSVSLKETVWSPDSRKVIISERSGNAEKAFTYDLVTKDTAYIDTGDNFIWSPSDKDLVAYLKHYSIYGKNLKSGQTELLFEGSKRREITDFRWDPAGEFLMINRSEYFLNMPSYLTWNPNHIYLSMSDKRESKTFFSIHRIDTWR